MERLGELAAFGTACCWTVSSLFFERASWRVGAAAVNFYKVCLAGALLALAAMVLRGRPFPLDAPAGAWLFFSLSGLVGFLVADYFLFNAYVLVGSRLTVLFHPLSPLFTAALGYLVLGERMRSGGIAGMGLVVAGILLVVLTRDLGAEAGPPGKPSPRGGATAKGLGFAFLSALFQSAANILSKLGLRSYDAIGGTQIRVLTAVAGFALQAVFLPRVRRAFAGAPRDRDAMKATAVGAVFGPFAGVTLSLVALQATSAGAASTLMGLTPVLIIPPSILVLKQRVRPLEIVGACVAVAGAALFFLL